MAFAIMPDMPAESITLAQTIHRCDHVVFQEVGGEAVLLDLASETYFGLNPVGTRIWQLIAEGARLQAIRDTLVVEYEADADRIGADLLALATQLRAAGLVRID